MKKLLFTLAIAALGLTAGAQDKKGSDGGIKFGVGALIGLPLGEWKDYASLAYGGDVQGEYAASEQLGITLSAGYVKFAGKNGITITGAFIPVLVGARVYFAEKAFFSGQLGMSFSTSSGGGSAFTYAPGFGYKVAENLDLLLKYQAATKSGSTTSFLGLRVGYTF